MGCLVNGKSGSAPITYYDTEKFKVKFACELKNYNIEDHFDRKEGRKLDKFAQYALVSSDEAILDSKLDLEKVDKFRVGVIWGAGIGGLETFQNEVMNFANWRWYTEIQSFLYTKNDCGYCTRKYFYKTWFYGS